MKHKPNQPGFTLIEILVTISIIAILMGIGVAAMSGVYKAGNLSQTKLILQGTANAITEYRAVTGNAPAESVSTPGGLDLDSEPLVYQLQQLPASEKILRTQSKYLKTTGDADDYEELYDAWDNEIRYYANSDGSEVPEHPTPFVVSAGPDGDFATLDDNLYSYEMD